MTRTRLAGLVGSLASISLWFLAVTHVSANGPELRLNLRHQTEVSPEAGIYHTLTVPTTWDARKTAVVVCDMWDTHWCPAATERVVELVPRLNQYVKALRKQGVLVIHCPSDTMKFYQDTPQRKRAQAAPEVKLAVEPQRWCHLDPKREPPLPIDDSRGGCDTVPSPKSAIVWTRQHPGIEIDEADVITDSVEALYLLEQRGIENVLVTGVATNMCVLGRPFGIRQLVYQGKTVALVRDLTDTMYDPEAEPKVSHFTGTDLVVGHIERHWCPTCTTADVLGGEPFRFKQDRRPHVVLLIGEDEYETEKTLPEFGLRELGKTCRVSYVFASAKEENQFPGLDVIDTADVLLISVRRRTLPTEQLALIRRHIEDGKPVVGIRTASHAFELRTGEPKVGLAQWREFDKQVFGCDYTNHFGREERSVVWRPESAQSDPLANGLPTTRTPVTPTLYQSNPLEKGARPILLGGLIGKDVVEPVAWTFRRADGGRSFYTSLGHVDDFKLPWFRSMLRRGVEWAASGD